MYVGFTTEGVGYLSSGLQIACILDWKLARQEAYVPT